MEPLIRNLENNNSVKTSVAYADDLILIEGNSRKELEELSGRALLTVNSYALLLSLK